jgi:hypothetical protein
MTCANEYNTGNDEKCADEIGPKTEAQAGSVKGLDNFCRKLFPKITADNIDRCKGWN